ncbi:MAG: porin, partial [Pseudomonadota bacterium]
MTKFLKSTTALALAASFVAGSAIDDAPKVVVHGDVTAAYAVVKQDKLYRNIDDEGANLDAKTSHHAQTSKMYTDAKLGVSASGDSDSGLKYKAEVKFDLWHNVDSITDFDKEQEGQDTNSGYQGSSVRLHHASVMLDTGMGRVDLGGVKSAAKALKVTAPSAKHADVFKFVYYDTGYTYADVDGQLAGTVAEPMRYLLSSELPGDQFELQAYSNKVAFFTPVFNGLQAGLSFTPNTNNHGSLAGFSSKYNSSVNQVVGLNNAVSAVVKYEHMLADDTMLMASLSGVSAQGKKAVTTDETNTFKKANAYELGLAAKMDEFTLGATYGNWGKSLNLKQLAVETGNNPAINSRNKSNTRYYTVGAMYQNGPVAVSADFFASKMQGNKARAYTLAGEYSLAEGLALFADLSMFKLTPKTGTDASFQLKSGDNVDAASGVAQKNDGTV